MKAQCCICSDLFVNDPDVNIAAVACGHTFHLECLMKWLESANTCPSCRTKVDRKRIIKKLYFDIDSDDQGEDASHLTNEVQNLKMQLRKKELSIAEVLKQKEAEEDEKRKLHDSIQGLERRLKKEVTANNLLKKELSSSKQAMQMVEQEKRECIEVKRKLSQMENIERLVTGSQHAAEEIISSYGTGEKATRDLAVYCALLKKEYENMKSEKKGVRNELDKLRRDFFAKETALQDRTKEVEYYKENFKRSETELKQTEKEKEILRLKMSKLRHSILSPAQSKSPSASFIEVLSEKTPLSGNIPKKNSFQLFVEDTPDADDSIMYNKFTKPAEVKTSEIPLVNPLKINFSPEVPAKSVIKTSEKVEAKKCAIIKDISDAPPPKRLKCDNARESENMMQYNILKKKQRNNDFSSIMSTGYDGLGGHTSFTFQKSTGLLNAKKSKVMGGKNSRMAKAPSISKFLK